MFCLCTQFSKSSWGLFNVHHPKNEIVIHDLDEEHSIFKEVTNIKPNYLQTHIQNCTTFAKYISQNASNRIPESRRLDTHTAIAITDTLN